MLVGHPSWAKATDERNKPVFLMVPMSKTGPAIASYLLKNGANVNCADADGKTLLHEAVHRGHLELVKLLIANGARVTARNKKGDSPLDQAVRSGRPEILEILKQAKDKPVSTTRP
jgi:ankyrin repeat protein